MTVYLDRHGRTVDIGGDSVAIPKFGGGDRTWAAIVGCVKQHYAPFNVDVVDTRPKSGTYITALVGGWASQLGLDDGTRRLAASLDALLSD